MAPASGITGQPGSAGAFGRGVTGLGTGRGVGRPKRPPLRVPFFPPGGAALAMTIILGGYMATLTQTLGKSPLNTTYSYPAVASPYPTFNPPGGGGGGNYGANLQFAPVSPYFTMQPQAQPQAAPSTQFQGQYDFDPVLAQISALSSQTIDKAQAAAQAAKNQAMIQGGDSALAKNLGFDANTVAATQQNTDVAHLSTLARLQKDAADRQVALTNALAPRNLYYSGYHAHQLGDQQQGLLQARNDFENTLKGVLSQIDQQLLAARLADQQRNTAAAIGAAGGVTGVYGGGGGGGGGGVISDIPPDDHPGPLPPNPKIQENTVPLISPPNTGVPDPLAGVVPLDNAAPIPIFNYPSGTAPLSGPAGGITRALSIAPGQPYYDPLSKTWIYP